MNRRTALANLSSWSIGAALGRLREAQAAQVRVGPRSRLRKIATEEAFTVPEVVNALRNVVRAGGSNLDLPLLATIYDAPTGTQPRFLAELLDLDEQRLADMDRNGVEVQLLSLTAPGVQMFDADTATSLASVANDRLAGIVRRHSNRYAALATFAPQDPGRAVNEMERAIQKLKFNGFIVNSHTNNEYLDRIASTKSGPITSCGQSITRTSPPLPPCRSSSRHRYPRITEKRLPTRTPSASFASPLGAEPSLAGVFGGSGVTS